MHKLRTLVSIDAVFFMFAAYLLIKGLLRREHSFLTAESGLGYLLGIVGGSMMLLLLLYPLRKHLRLLSRMGPVRFWFRFHMLLGVLGPVLILYHANFGLGSTNSNIALFSMLIVAGSGLFGRLFYRKIHDGLYGRKLELGELKQSLDELKESFDQSDVHDRMQALERQALRPRSLLLALFYMPWLRISARRVRRQVIAALRRQLDTATDRNQVIAMKRQADAYFMQVLRVADFSVYQRLFSLWHVLHIPLFIMMIISGVVHVFAVHIY